MPTLFSWYLKKHGSVLLGHGVVSGHPKLAEGTRVHTSPILNVSATTENVQLETQSGSIYRLQPEALSTIAGKEDFPLPPPEKLGLQPDFWVRCIQARNRAREKELTSLYSPETLRLRIVGTTALSALWYGLDRQVRRIPIRTHIGMFQKSVLVMDFFEGPSGPCRVDFRYFPYPNRITPYQISAEMETILIVNEGCRDVYYGRQGQEILCAAGKTVKIPVRMIGGQV